MHIVGRRVCRRVGAVLLGSLVIQPCDMCITSSLALQGSLVAFSLNGQSQGVAYSPVLDGLYFPAASLYTMPSEFVLSNL